MVEFALALPILLLIVYGLIETGRLIFIYASVTTASRQAVRYGSAVGVNDSGTRRYQDCVGIRAAAKSVAFIFDLQDSDIDITYDRGLDNDGAVVAIPGIDPNLGSDTCPVPDDTVRNGDRIKVQVTTQYTPIVSLVPLEPMTITASSARTLLVSVAIEVTAPPQGWTGSTETASPTPTATASDTPTPSPTPTATYTPTPTPSHSPTPSRTPTITPTPSKTPTPSNTPTPTNTAITCDVRHTGLEIAQSSFGVRIYNLSPVPINIEEIQVFWNNSSPAGQSIKRITLGGSTIWTGTETGSPAVFSTFSGDVSIGPNSNKFLDIVFNKNYKVNGTERILVSFVENGCPILDTDNINPPP